MAREVFPNQSSRVSSASENNSAQLLTSSARVKKRFRLFTVDSVNKRKQSRSQISNFSHGLVGGAKDYLIHCRDSGSKMAALISGGFGLDFFLINRKEWSHLFHLLLI